MNGRRFSRLKSCLCIFNAPACSPDAPRTFRFPLAPFLQSLDNHASVTDPWEKRMAEGIAFLQRKAKESKNG